MKHALPVLRILPAALLLLSGCGAPVRQIEVQILRPPLVVTNEARPQNAIPDFLPFVVLKRALWNAESWEEVASLHTAASIVTAEKSGEKAAFEKIKADHVRPDSAETFTAYVSYRDQAGAQHMIVQSVPYAAAPEETDTMFTFQAQGMTLESGVWKWDRSLEDSALARLVTQTHPSALASSVFKKFGNKK